MKQVRVFALLILTAIGGKAFGTSDPAIGLFKCHGQNNTYLGTIGFEEHNDSDDNVIVHEISDIVDSADAGSAQYLKDAKVLLQKISYLQDFRSLRGRRPSYEPLGVLDWAENWKSFTVSRFANAVNDPSRVTMFCKRIK